MVKIRVDRFIQSRRKTIGLEVTSGGELVVRAPYSVNRNLLQDFLNKKAGWIMKKKALAKKRTDINRDLDLETSNKVLFLGKYFPVKIHRGKRVFFDQGFFVPETDAAGKKKAVTGWLKKEARKYLNFRVERLAGRLGIDYGRIRITSAKKRWGSCSGGSNLNFTYRLIMAPAEVIDYVIIHELMHIRQQNHSKKFWKEVAQAIPDYKKYQRWLKDNGYRLVV